MLNILLPIDGSDFAQRALETVAKMAKRTDGLELMLVNVRHGPAYYGEFPPYDYESIEARERQRQQDLLKAASDEAHRLGLTRVKVKGAEGAIATEIVRAADEYGADQIVMGTHGRGAVAGLFIGSVAQRVVHLARAPVLLVK